MKIFKRIVLRSLLIFLSVTLLLTIAVMSFVKLAPQFGAAPSGKALEKITLSENYHEDHFVNLIPTSMDMKVKDGVKVMYEWLFNADSRMPDKPLPVAFQKKAESEVVAPVALTWYGHSALLLEMDGKKIFLDPMLGNAASPVAFMTKRFAYTEPIDIENLPHLDAVVLSHDHYDHLDYGTIKKIKDRVDHFFTPLGVGAHLRRWGVDDDKITELDWWQSVALEGLKITATPARHFSGRGLTDRNKTQWASWVIESKNSNIYFSGDSGYGPHFKQIGERLGPFDFAMMECGQYNERWAAIHMMPEQTIQAAMDVKARKMMPIHWSAFNLSLHAWTEPVERAIKAAKIHEMYIITPQIGERFVPDDFPENDYWWRPLL